MRLQTFLVGGVLASALLTGCSGTTQDTQSTVTTTAAAVTVTADPVTPTAEPVSVTPPAVTIDPPRVTATAPAVTVTAAAGDAEEDDVQAAPAQESTALEALASLPVKGRAPKTGYDRDGFGSAWTDATTAQGSRNGCDTRNDVLRRDLDDLVVQEGTAGCVASTGTLDDPYSGQEMTFVRGEDSASRIHIDHVVSLSNAWQTGAQQLIQQMRENLANDPLNLWAVDGSLNQAKGDGDAATWLPPNTSIRCELVARQVAVKAEYQLWVTPPEAEAIARVLGDCPTEPLPTLAQWSIPATS